MEIDIENVVTELDTLKDTEAKMKFELNTVQKHINQLELQLQAVLTANNVENMQVHEFYFGWKPTSRVAFNQALFKAEHPETFELYKTVSEGKKFEFKVV